MAFDGLTVRTISCELNQQLIGCRITKIYQPHRYQLVFHCRKPGISVQLLISGHPQYARIHLSNASIPNPPSPPAFCMLLRKHLEGGKICSIAQIGFERIVQIDIENLTESGQLASKRLLVEIMGRHSNVILLNADHSTILDAMTRVTEGMSRYRQIAPGETYILPPGQGKLDPTTTSKEQFISRFAPAEPNKKIFRLLVDHYQGISPTTAKEIVARTGLQPTAERGELSHLENLWHTLQTFIEATMTGKLRPSVAVDENNRPVDFAPFPLTMYGTSYMEKKTVSEAIEQYYQYKENQSKIKELAGELTHVLSAHLKRLDGKITKQENTLKAAKDAEQYRILGELLTANLYRVKRGTKSIVVENFYGSPPSVTIALDPSLSPAENAQRLFKKYTKLKNSLTVTSKQLAISKAEKEYIVETLASIELAESLNDLVEIREELVAGGYITTRKTRAESQKNRKTPSAKPLRFVSSDGFNLYVGRNNRQNDYVTFGIGKPEDIWLHVKNIPGAHVLINAGHQTVPDSTIKEAALLAAYYSKGRQASNVAVDYTKRKHVHKPAGARPGKVIYDHYSTIFVTPDPRKIASITRVETE